MNVLRNSVALAVLACAVEFLTGCRSTPPAASREPSSAELAQSLRETEAESAQLQRQAQELEELLQRSRTQLDEQQELIRILSQAQPPTAGDNRPRAVTVAQLAAAEEPAPATAPTAPAAGDGKAGEDAAKQAREEAKKARERQRRLDKLARELESAQLRLEKVRLANEHAAVQHEEALTRATREAVLEKQKQRNFEEAGAPNRIARTELHVRGGEDGLREAQQELEQLELMYAEDEFADQTKEIVIERARRSLERTERDLQLRRQELAILVDRTLPQETADQDLAVRQKEEAVRQLERGRKGALLEERLAIMGAEAEITRLELELADVHEEIREATAEAGPVAPHPVSQERGG